MAMGSRLLRSIMQLRRKKNRVLSLRGFHLDYGITLITVVCFFVVLLVESKIQFSFLYKAMEMRPKVVLYFVDTCIILQDQN